MLQSEVGGSVSNGDFDSPVSALKIKKIILPVDFPNTSLGLLHQAAALAHHFHSEVVMLHVMTELSHETGAHDNGLQISGSHRETIIRAQKNLDRYLGREFRGLAIHRMLVNGNPVQAFVQAAQAEKADLIMMSSHGLTFSQFLLHPGTAKVNDCPIWTNPQVEESPAQEFVIRNILCAVDFDPPSHTTVSWAAQMAAEFGARLTLAHVTASLKRWGPGGSYVDPEWKKLLVSAASQHLEKLRQDWGIEADIFIGNGDMPNVLGQAAKQTKADLLVNECYPYCGNLGLHGFSIISSLPIPVLSV
jgi:nucleotide-binding universal stress UspA family protein